MTRIWPRNAACSKKSLGFTNKNSVVGLNKFALEKLMLNVCSQKQDRATKVWEEVKTFEKSQLEFQRWACFPTNSLSYENEWYCSSIMLVVYFRFKLNKRHSSIAMFFIASAPKVTTLKTFAEREFSHRIELKVEKVNNQLPLNRN